MKHGYFACLLVLVLLSVPAPGNTAQEDLVTVSASVNWEKQLITVRAQLDLRRAGIKIPSGRDEAELYLKTRFPLECKEAVLNLGFDSYRSITDTLDDQTIAPAEIEHYMDSWTLVSSALSKDLSTLTMEVTYDLVRLASLYIRHTKALELPVIPEFEPTRSYSGIIIYAKGTYGIQGEFEKGFLIPSLFPRIYDETMLLIMERNRINPEVLRISGQTGWTKDLASPGIALRAGSDPLRILAYRIFGTRRSDIIITRQDALKILLNESNRALIRDGKVVIVYGE